MIHPKVIDARREQLNQKLREVLPPGGLKEYSVAEVREFVDYRLPTIFDKQDPRKMVRDFTREERTFITNEQIMGKISFPYWGERYWQINFQGQAIAPLYPLWDSQKLILQHVGQIEYDRWSSGHPDGVMYLVLKARQLGACLDPATRVLTADLRWVAIDTLTVGDSLVSTEEFPRGGRGAGRRMVPTRVEARTEVQEESFELTFATGQTVIASAPHRFLARRRAGVETQWRAVQDMHVGDVVRYVTTPWDPPTVEDGWFAGLLDGEGSMSARAQSGAEINVAQVAGPVFDRALRYLHDHAYAVRIEVDKAERPSKFGCRPVNKLCVSRMDELFRLVGQLRPTRFIGRAWWQGKELPGKRNGFGWARLVSIRSVGVRRLIDLQTSTKTFIAEGLVSHNSTLSEAIIGHRTTCYAHVFGLIASDEPDAGAFLFDMYERGVERLPFYMRPVVTEHVKNDEMVFETGSRTFVGWSRAQRKGSAETGKRGQLGRGKTISVLHLSELASWEQPEQIDEALMPAVPMTPLTFGALESTAKGRFNWWHKNWMAAKAGKSRYSAVFIPWYAEPAKYWLPVPPAWVPNLVTLAHARRAAEYGPRWMHGPVALTKEQLYWYEFTRGQSELAGKLSSFLEEYPSDDEEAFQHSGKSIFTLQVRERIRDKAKPIQTMVEVESYRALTRMGK